MAAAGASKLTARQATVLAALMRCADLRSAARAVGVPERTVRSWVRDNPAFRSEYARLATEMMAAGLRGVQALTGQAARVLRKALGSEDPKVSLKAALGVLDRAVRAAELLDLAERVEQLEAAEQERATANGASLNGRMR